MFDRWLIMSDMDGTLLNHHDYSVEAALPLLRKLEESGIPVVFNTSKTFAELKDWVRLLDNKHPFIVENGSAIYIPDNYFSRDFYVKYFPDVKTEFSYQIIITGAEIQSIHEFVKKQQPDAIDLSKCELQQAIEITGLAVEDARAAQTRQFSVPLMFRDDNQQQNFAEKARRAGFGILKGGRFLHVLGLCDKGQALETLKSMYQNFYRQTFGVIALGDSPNDLAMLNRADLPVVVKSPSSDSVDLDHPMLINTRREAPEGWVEGIQSALVKMKISLR